MKTLLLFVLIVSCAAFAEAQPWQWELYAEDFYNPTAFPDLGSLDYGEGVIGDFDGNGRDDFLYGIYVAVCDTDRFHWTMTTMANAPGGYSYLAYNLDTDAADEIITFSQWTDSTHAWKLISSDPWTWQQRDDLLTGLSFPTRTYKAVVGDYNGYGLLNAICWTKNNGVDTVRLYTRLLNGSWHAGTFYYPSSNLIGEIRNILDGDFDQDGDSDFGIMTEPPADPVVLWGYFFKNTGDGIADPVQNYLYFEAGGDLDGDGDWDGLGRVPYRYNYSLVHTAPDSAFFHVTGSSYLGRFDGRVFGNLRVNGQTVVAGVYNCTQEVVPGQYTYSFWTESRSPMGWAPVLCGFSLDFGYHCASASLGDLDGDGHKDLLAVLSRTWWAIYRNAGLDSTDRFAQVAFVPAFVQGLSVTDFPQLGDITGDGRAEFGLVDINPDGNPEILFYEIVGAFANMTFVQHFEWDDGLPLTSNFRLADIDNDGISEAMLYNGSSWDCYFFRDGHWDLYTDILPNVTANDISFADANNDGNLDLFTSNEVWLNLNPSSSDRDFIPHPSSYILSAFPNPFNPVTQLSFDLPHAGKVTLQVFDLVGREVVKLADGWKEAGINRITWNAKSQPSGLYFARLTAPGGIRTIKLCLTK